MNKSIICLVAGSLTLAALSPAALAAAPPRHPAVQSSLDVLTEKDGMPGALAYAVRRDGTTLTVRSGTWKKGSGEPMIGPEGRFRIASMTKPIMAAAILRLVEQGRVDLDATVEHYLPGVVRGTGDGAAIDGRKITVRMLLQQTSGLPEFVDAVDWNNLPDSYLDVALGRKPSKRGEFAYANTNYVVLGLIMGKVTGKDFREASRDLVLKPYGMRSTYWPAKGDTGLKGPHARTYGIYPIDPDKGVVDLTSLLPTYEIGASGCLVSSPEDLNRFWKRAPLDRMGRSTVKIRQEGWPKGARYGFGVARTKTSCGSTAWFHGGDMPGASTVSGRDAAGRAATVYVTSVVSTPKQREHLLEALDATLCAR
ncbi:MAG: beta-lactamase family protein [Nonomuraea sp.]|nr:beta-lactamase family protein [Nonomuraea sp.]